MPMGCNENVQRVLIIGLHHELSPTTTPFLTIWRHEYLVVVSQPIFNQWEHIYEKLKKPQKTPRNILVIASQSGIWEGFFTLQRHRIPKELHVGHDFLPDLFSFSKLKLH